MSKLETGIKVTCYHCGDFCEDQLITLDNKSFCCSGCKLVFEVLLENNLCTYYNLQSQPGNSQKNTGLGNRFAYLDQPEIADKLIRFRDTESVHLRFHIPAMHCSSCIWLLEHLSKLDAGVIRTQVDFIQKELLVVYHPDQTSLRKIVELLVSIGYEPELNFSLLQAKSLKKEARTRIYKIGIAGFAFGNIMLLSFPEYFSGGVYTGEDFRQIFGYLNLALALPVFFYCANEFLINTWRSFQQRTINIDVPIAIGIVAMFLRSSYEVLSGSGAGYFDSMTGLVFFMLIGRNFQAKTYKWLSFERDYKSYFPIAVSRLKGTQEESVTINELKINDRLLIHNNEIIPADVLLLDESAYIDYSFVTGESNPVSCKRGEQIFAGGRLTGSAIEVIIKREVSQSYLTQLWNQADKKSESKNYFQRISNGISRWFVIITIIIASAAFLFWYPNDLTRAVNAFTSVLVIACACALALSAPFTFGNMLRILGKNGIYLKNASVLERLADIKSIVFDKTGTLTIADSTIIDYIGDELSEKELIAVRTISCTSSHPLSKILSQKLISYKTINLSQQVNEILGAGIEGKVDDLFVKIGSESFTGSKGLPTISDFTASRVYVNINGLSKGYFAIHNQYRSGVHKVIQQLQKKKFEINIVSGDHDGELPYLEKLVNSNSGLYFNQSPGDKLEFIKKRQSDGKKILMVGDGLNDAGALLQSDVGLAITADINNFSPACDGIVLNNRFDKIPALINYSRSGIRIIIVSFILSLLYNAAGLWFAVQGTLSPVIAAILMPISTSSLVLFTVISSSIKARQLGLNKPDNYQIKN